jgi:hypothetical protein
MAGKVGTHALACHLVEVKVRHLLRWRSGTGGVRHVVILRIGFSVSLRLVDWDRTVTRFISHSGVKF